MNLGNKPYTSLWYDSTTQVVSYIDQTKLPWELCIKQLNSLDDAIRAIKNMEVRGAPLIGVTAAFGFAIALRNQLNSPTNPTPHTPKPQATKHQATNPQATTPQATNHQATKPPSHQATKLPSHQATKPPSPQATIYNLLLSTRPTAINLKWALDQMLESLQIPSERSELQSHGEQSEPPIPREAKSHGEQSEPPIPREAKSHGEQCEPPIPREAKSHGEQSEPPIPREQSERTTASLFTKANQIRQSEIDRSHAIGSYGLEIIKQKYAELNRPINILTHCNAGWLATIDFGTATAPIYLAHEAGIPVHVWVDETRPRNQGAKLTAYELNEHGVPCTLIPDNTGGHLMQNGLVDLVIVGTDRVAANGDVANKIGTYLKALAAKDNEVPFYVAMPTSSFDANTPSGRDIPIEQRDPKEVLEMEGITTDNNPGQQGHNTKSTIKITADGIQAANYGFDITPANLITAYITEYGILSSLKP